MAKTKEDLSSLNLPDPEVKTVYFFGHGGKAVDEKYALAKNVVYKKGDENFSSQFFVKVGMGELLDPYQVDFGIGKSKMSQMYNYKKVSEKGFNAYMQYLNTKNRIHFTNARRLIMG